MRLRQSSTVILAICVCPLGPLSGGPLEKLGMKRGLARGLEAGSADNGRQILLRLLEVFVNYTVIKLTDVLDLFGGVGEPLADGSLGVFSSGAQAPLQFVQGRRQDENADRIGKNAAHLASA